MPIINNDIAICQIIIFCMLGIYVFLNLLNLTYIKVLHILQKKTYITIFDKTHSYFQAKILFVIIIIIIVYIINYIYYK